MKRSMPALAAMVIALGAATARAGEASDLTVVLAQPVAPTTVTATGRVQALTTARISPRVSGHLMELGQDAQGHALDAGMMVRKGDLLFALDETTFKNAEAAAEATLDSARAVLADLKAPPRPERVDQLTQAIVELQARLEDKKRDEDRYVRLVEEKTAPAKRLEEAHTDVIATAALLQVAKSRLAELQNGATATEVAVAEAKVKEAEAALKTARDDRRDSQVRAPFDGLITLRLKSVGDFIASNPPVNVLELVAVDALEVELRVPESYLARVRAGVTKVKLAGALLKTPLPATVTRVVADIDPARGTFVCRVAVPPDSGLAPGAFVTADLLLDDAAGQVLVPARAIVTNGAKNFVLVVTDGKLKRREVTVVERLTENAILSAGLTPGEEVAVGPAEVLREGAPAPTAPPPASANAP